MIGNGMLIVIIMFFFFLLCQYLLQFVDLTESAAYVSASSLIRRKQQ